MGKKSRHSLPFITGEYATKAEIRVSAREYFLVMIQAHAPRPLLLLRDKLLPTYRVAFKFEKSRGRSDTDVQRLALRALVNVVVVGETDGLKSSPEFKDPWRESPLLYKAATRLVDWSVDCNLQGLPDLVDKPPGEPASKDASWTLIAAIETILYWHFAPAGWLHGRRQPPHWRPPLHILKGPSEVSDSLAPVELKRPICWRPMNPRYKHPDAQEYLGEVDEPAWRVQLEREKEFRERMTAAFNKWLGAYITCKKKTAEGEGLVKVPTARELSHFIWAAKYQVDKASTRSLATVYGVSPEAVRSGIEAILNLIRLEPRLGARGPKPSARQAR